MGHCSGWRRYTHLVSQSNLAAFCCLSYSFASLLLLIFSVIVPVKPERRRCCPTLQDAEALGYAPHEGPEGQLELHCQALGSWLSPTDITADLLRGILAAAAEQVASPVTGLVRMRSDPSYVRLLLRMHVYWDSAADELPWYPAVFRSDSAFSSFCRCLDVKP